MADLEDLYRRAASDLRGHAERTAERIYGAWLAGSINDAEFREVLHLLLMTGVKTGRQIADVIGSRAVGGAPSGLGLAADDVERLAKAAGTITLLLDAEPDLTWRVQRVAVGETLHALQQGVVDNYRANDVDGYRRGLSASACELCRWLYKDGYVYPTGQPMHQHPGCTCVPIPVNEGEPSND